MAYSLRWYFNKRSQKAPPFHALHSSRRIPLIQLVYGRDHLWRVAMTNMTDKRNRILLVEDFEDGRIALSKLLQVEGYTVLEATDGAQAIEIATRERPDLVLMDLSLPV